MNNAQPISKTGLWRVIVLALAGHAFIFLVLLLQVLLIAYCIHYVLAESSFLFYRVVAALLVIVLSIGVYHLLRAMFARNWVMRGYELPIDAPLHLAMRELAEKIGSPVPSKIFIDDEFNASAGVNKGFLPWLNESYVTVGVPLAAALSADELRAVLAHELGHHSRKHSRVANWVYRVRSSWDGVGEAFDHLPGFVAHAVMRFYNWFIPVFQRESYAVARANEFEADAVAASVVGAQALASGLARVETVAPWLEERYWPKVFDLAGKRPEPPSGIMAHLSRSLTNLDGATLESRFRAIDPTSQHEHDTHPSLEQRVCALGLSLAPPPPVTESGLTQFGSHLDSVLDHLSREWREKHTETWNLQHQRKHWVRERIAALGANPETLSVTSLRELASLYVESGRQRDALACFRTLYQRRKHPRDIACCAEILAQVEGQRGKARELARKAMGTDPSVDLEMTQLLLGLSRDADECRQLAFECDRLAEVLEVRQALLEEGAMGLEQARALKAPKLEAADRERIMHHLDSTPGVVEAHIVEVESDDEYQWRQFFLFVLVEQDMTDQAQEAFWERVTRECWLGYGDIITYSALDELRAWGKAHKVPGARLLEHKGKAAT